MFQDQGTESLNGLLQVGPLLFVMVCVCLCVYLFGKTSQSVLSNICGTDQGTQLQIRHLW